MDLEVRKTQAEAEPRSYFRTPLWMKTAVLTGLLFLAATPAFAESPAAKKPNKPNKQGDYAASVKPGACAPFEHPVWETGTKSGRCLDFLNDSTELGEQVGLHSFANTTAVQPETRYKIVRTAQGIEVNFSVEGPLSTYGFGIEVSKGQQVSVPSLGNSFAFYDVDYSADEPSVSMRWTTVFPQLP